MMSLVMVLSIGCAGAIGALARFGVVEGMARRWSGLFPLATFLINITGAFVLGFALTTGAGHLPAAAPVRTIIGTGFLGGYTTFSTLSFETHALSRRGHTLHAWLNALGTLAAGVMAASIGILLGQRV